MRNVRVHAENSQTKTLSIHRCMHVSRVRARHEVWLKCEPLRFFSRFFARSFSGCLEPSDGSSDTFRLATTTSMRDSGLLDVLIEDFEAVNGFEVEYVAVGTGAALQLGRAGDVDALIVHAPDQEQAFIDDGYATKRTPIAHNAFVLLSPTVLNGSVYDAFEAIAEQEHCFVSRGDNSGTHAKEQAIWRHSTKHETLPSLKIQTVFIPPGRGISPSARAWVRRSTWRMRKTAQRCPIAVQPFDFRTPSIWNGTNLGTTSCSIPYAYLIVEPANSTAAQRFGDYLLNEGKSIIASYTINGDHPFFVDS